MYKIYPERKAVSFPLLEDWLYISIEKKTGMNYETAFNRDHFMLFANV